MLLRTPSFQEVSFVSNLEPRTVDVQCKPLQQAYKCMLCAGVLTPLSVYNADFTEAAMVASMAQLGKDWWTMNFNNTPSTL